MSVGTESEGKVELAIDYGDCVLKMMGKAALKARRTGAGSGDRDTAGTGCLDVGVQSSGHCRPLAHECRLPV